MATAVKSGVASAAMHGLRAAVRSQAPEHAGHGVVAAAIHTVSTMQASSDFEYEHTHILIFVVICFAVTFLCCGLTTVGERQLTTPGNGDRLRFVGFVVLHLADWSTNIISMCIFVSLEQYRYLWLTLPIHLFVGAVCAFTAIMHPDIREWDIAPPLKYTFALVVLGGMQMIQLKLAWDDYIRICAQRSAPRSQIEERVDPEVVPSTMSSKFHCKVIDGLLEGTFFAFVCTYICLKAGLNEFQELSMSASMVLSMSAFFSLMTTGLALTEMDHRISEGLHRMLANSVFARAKHMAFRASEVLLRVFTVTAWLVFVKPNSHDTAAVVSFLIIGLDYIAGVALLCWYGGYVKKDFFWLVTNMIIGVPLYTANVMQFVDVPGMAVPARRISSFLVSVRFVELITMLLCLSMVPPPIENNENHDSVDFLFTKHLGLSIMWGCSFCIFFTSLFLYASRVPLQADLHSIVREDDVVSLEQMLGGQGEELVINVNRYGIDGKVPLHVAVLHGSPETIGRLIEAGAKIHLRTADASTSTIMHLAAVQHEVDIVREVLRYAADDVRLLNAQDAMGNTALHVAVRHQNLVAIREFLCCKSIDREIQNNEGFTAIQTTGAFNSAPKDSFHFAPQNKVEAIDALFRASAQSLEREADASRPPQTPQSIELQQASSHSRPSSSRPSAATPSSARKSHPKLQQSRDIALVDVSESSAKKQNARSGKDPSPVVTPTKSFDHSKVNLSSFLLTSGLGAFSKAFLETVKEDEVNQGTQEASGAVTLNDFEELKLLGAGTFGKVWLVKRNDTGDLYAMKLLDKAKFKVQHMTSKAYSEKNILRTMDHPFMVRLHYAFQGPQYWCLVMDFCPNGDAHDYLVAHGHPGLEPLTVARLCGESLLGLEYMHLQGVIFRDLKPENVVLDPDLHAKITDFGLAKRLDEGQIAKTVCGSYGYVAPEIMAARQTRSAYTIAVDIYSLGVMLYVLLHGGEEVREDGKKRRLPPMEHEVLRNKIHKLQAKDYGDAGAQELLLKLTSRNAVDRPTSTTAKEHRFFVKNLGGSVDGLLPKNYTSITGSVLDNTTRSGGLRAAAGNRR